MRAASGEPSHTPNAASASDLRPQKLRPRRLAALFHPNLRTDWTATVSVVHVANGAITGPYLLDGRQAPIITAYLFHDGGHDNPEKLAANGGKCYQGSVLLGMGFTFDGRDPDGVANPISKMRELIEADPRNAERIFPYIGGEELNNEPTQAPRRYTIDFADMSESEARKWPDLMAIIEERVLPDRRGQGRSVRRDYWWRHAERAKGLYESIASCDRVLAINCGATPHMSFAFLPARMVFANTLDVSCLDTNGAFCVLQSRIHEVWARFFASSMKDDLRYTPSDCFETFPFPEGVIPDAAPDSPASGNQHTATLEAAGSEYYEFRASLMIRNNEGLTKTYNRFHDQGDMSPDIVRLRQLHDAMDRAVLDAYGWTVLRPDCEFLLDYEDEDDADEEPTGRTRRKPWRYRWPDDVRDEVLARLLKLNAERAAAERRTGVAIAAAAPRGRSLRSRSIAQAPNLFDDRTT